MAPPSELARAVKSCTHIGSCHGQPFGCRARERVAPPHGCRRSNEQQRIHEVRVLGYNRALLAQRDPVYVTIGRSIPVREISGVNHIVASFPHPAREP